MSMVFIASARPAAARSGSVQVFSPAARRAYSGWQLGKRLAAFTVTSMADPDHPGPGTARPGPTGLASTRRRDKRSASAKWGVHILHIKF
jgi:hypothetical protein